MRAIAISLLGARAALMITVIAGCANTQQSNAQAQNKETAASSTPRHVEGLCASPDAPPADLANKPGYQQFVVTVTDASGQPVAGLTQQNFVLYEESQNLPIDYFREDQNDEPVAIALVVDTSGSMEPKLPVVKQSLGNFVENLNRCDEVVVFAFSGHTYLLLPFSIDHQLAAKRMELFHAYGQTTLYDATYNALQMLATADYPNRKIILITDGIDNHSTVTQDEVVALAKTDGVPIYAVGIGDPNAVQQHSAAVGPFVVGPPDQRLDAKSVEALSAASGGRSFMVPDTGADAGKGFINAISTIADNIVQGYTIGAVVPADVTLSKINVAVVNRPDLIVRARLITTEKEQPKNAR